jgi:hypothetical protein
VKTQDIPFAHLRLHPSERGDHYTADRAPAVWQLDDDCFIVVAGR